MRADMLTGTMRTISEIGWNKKSPFRTSIHQLKCFHPSGNNTVDGEYSRCPTLYGTVKNSTIDQRPMIMALHLIVGRWFSSVAINQHLVLKATGKGDNTGFGSILSKKGDAGFHIFILFLAAVVGGIVGGKWSNRLQFDYSGLCRF